MTRKIKVCRKGYTRKDGTHVRGTCYTAKDRGKRGNLGAFEGSGKYEGIFGSGFCSLSQEGMYKRIRSARRRGYSAGDVGRALGRLKGAYKQPACKKRMLDKCIDYNRKL